MTGLWLRCRLHDSGIGWVGQHILNTIVFNVGHIWTAIGEDCTGKVGGINDRKNSWVRGLHWAAKHGGYCDMTGHEAMGFIGNSLMDYIGQQRDTFDFSQLLQDRYCDQNDMRNVNDYADWVTDLDLGDGIGRNLHIYTGTEKGEIFITWWNYDGVGGGHWTTGRSRR